MAYLKNVLIRHLSAIRKYKYTNTDIKSIVQSFNMNIILPEILKRLR